MSGKEVVQILRKDRRYDNINILVFTNMSNDIMSEELLNAGASKVITKIDIEALATNIKQFMG